MNYVQLAKPRSVLLLLVTALTGMVVASPTLPTAIPLILTVVAGGLAAGGANVLNCYLDRDLDGLMARTSGRPLPLGKIQSTRALIFGLGLCLASVVLFAIGVN